MSPSSGPPLGRHQLLRVLALPSDASEAAIRAASLRLRQWLETRLGRVAPEAVDEQVALARELAALEWSTAWWTDAGARPDARSSSLRLGRWGLAPWALAFLALLGLLVAYASGLRLTRRSAEESPTLDAAPGRIVLDGKLEGATLRVFDADRVEVLEEQPAAGARLELAPGRYALEVRREDCPDAWTRSVYVEAGGVHRFAPEICAGHGTLVVRANTEDDRLRIDDYDVGHSGDRVHRLPVGDHTVRVDKSGHRPFEARVRIEPGKAVELRADLVRLSEAEAKAGRPMPVTKLAPSAPPVEAVAEGRAFTPQELRPEVAPPKIEPPDLGLPRRGAFLERDGLPAMPDGGSTAWHDRVARELRERFDSDRSGEIDQLVESEAISCSVWKEIERDFDRGGLGLSLAHYFGFDGSEWHPGALSVARAHRSAVYAKMRECGLEP